MRLRPFCFCDTFLCFIKLLCVSKRKQLLAQKGEGQKSKAQRLGICAYLETFHARAFLTKSSFKQTIISDSKKMSWLRQGKHSTVGCRT